MPNASPPNSTFAPSKQGTFHAHGVPLGEDEVRAAKENLGWPTDPVFHVPDDVLAHCRQAVPRGQQWKAEWEAALARYEAAYPDLAAEFRRRMAGDFPDGWDQDMPFFPVDGETFSTRRVSEAVLQVLASRLPELMGGSACLNSSCRTWLKGQGDFQVPGTKPDFVQGAVVGGWDYAGRNVHFGVREHAMVAIVNGMALHGGFIPYAATFFIFCDYLGLL